MYLNYEFHKSTKFHDKFNRLAGARFFFMGRCYQARDNFVNLPILVKPAWPDFVSLFSFASKFYAIFAFVFYFYLAFVFYFNFASDLAFIFYFDLAFVFYFSYLKILSQYKQKDVYIVIADVNKKTKIKLHTILLQVNETCKIVVIDYC